jgi:hypothetical protein
METVAILCEDLPSLGVRESVLHGILYALRRMRSARDRIDLPGLFCKDLFLHAIEGRVEKALRLVLLFHREVGDIAAFDADLDDDDVGVASSLAGFMLVKSSLDIQFYYYRYIL